MRKKLITLLSIFSMVLLFAGACSSSSSGEEEKASIGLVYTISNNDTEYSVTDYNGTATDVYIPSSYSGKPVTSLGENAFRHSSIITSINLPKTIKSIDETALSDCSALANIIVDSANPNYKTIDGNLYSKDGKILVKYATGKTNTEFTVPNHVESIGKYAFDTCINLTNLVIPNNVTEIDSFAFENSASLKSVDFSNNLTRIGSYTFSKCIALESIEIPNSVTELGSYTFYGCKSLKTVVIPDSVTSMGYAAFDGCEIEKATLPSSVLRNINTRYLKEVIITSGDCIDYEALRKAEYLVSVVIPNSVTSIGIGAFDGCKSLASIVIPNSVTSIGDNAFFGCASLKSVVIPNSVTEMGTWVFSNCYSLESVVLGNGLTTISEGAFYLCKSLKTIVIPKTITRIGGSVLRYCESLTNIKYCGSSSQWKGIIKGSLWDSNAGSYTMTYNYAG